MAQKMLFWALRPLWQALGPGATVAKSFGIKNAAINLELLKENLYFILGGGGKRGKQLLGDGSFEGILEGLLKAL